MKINKTDRLDAFDLDGKIIATFDADAHGINCDLRALLAYPDMARAKITTRRGAWRIINRAAIAAL